MIFDVLLFAVCVVLLVSAGILLVMVTTLAVELIAMLFWGSDGAPPSTGAADAAAAGTYVVVIPAHDEVGTIEKTLSAVMGQLAANGRVLVVADNCSDKTAEVATAAGASVIERKDPTRRGKSYALDFAVRSLETNPPEVVIILDADCILEPGALGKLVAACRRWNRPIQARYEMDTPEVSAGTLARVGAFAWRVKNVVRPLGLGALGVPCLLMGTGMAFPWPILVRSNLSSGHLVEDMVLGLELAAEGRGPVFYPEASVRSRLPLSVEGQKSQRARWETGHLQVIWSEIPGTLWQAIKRVDFRLFFLALHGAVPPLALLVLTLAAVTIASGLVMLAGGPAICFAVSALAAGIGGAVFAAYWFVVGRDLLTVRNLLMLPGYVLSKLSIYLRAIPGRRLEWIRSKRD